MFTNSSMQHYYHISTVDKHRPAVLARLTPRSNGIPMSRESYRVDDIKRLKLQHYLTVAVKDKYGNNNSVLLHTHM